MAFDLTFTDTIAYALVAANREATGEIVIGDLKETFFAALHELSKRDYMRQWLSATRRLDEGCSRSAIITSLAPCGGEVLGMWWPLYVREGGQIAVQNRLILRDVVGVGFTLEACYEHIGSYSPVTEDGERISEWNTTSGEVAAFAARLEARLAEWE